MGYSYTFLITLSIITLGYILKKGNILTEEIGKNLSRVVINVTLPGLILNTIPYIELDGSMIIAPVCGFIFSLIMAFVASKVFKNEERKLKGVAELNTLGFNVGLFAYPIIEGLFGVDGLRTIAMFDFGNAFVVFGLAYFIAYSHSDKSLETPLNPKRILKLFIKSIPFMSYIISIIINLFGWKIPEFPTEVISIIARANMGLVLIVLGLNLNFRFNKKHWGIIGKVLALRYSLGIILGIFLYYFLPYSQLYRTIILFGLILPVPVVVVPYSVEFDFDNKLSGTIANFTILISFVLMWLFMILSS